MRNVKKRLYFGILFAAFFVLMGVGGYYIKSSRGGVVVTCEAEFKVKEDLLSFRQDEEAWKKDRLGNSRFRMKDSGCLVTCIASAISEKDHVITPGELNRIFSEKNVYDGEGNLQWGGLRGIDGFEAEVYEQVSESIIQACLKEHHYPIVRVQRKAPGGNHFVLIVGAMDGEYVCMDPLEDEFTELSKYGNRIYSIRCVWYEP